MEKKLVELFELVLDINKDETSEIKVHLHQTEREIVITVYSKKTNEPVRHMLISDLTNKNKSQKSKLKVLCKYLIFNSI